MDINNSIIYKDFLEIVNNGETETNYNWKLTILVPDGNGYKEITPLKMIGLTIKRDYINNFADVITCRCLMLGGDYEYDIYDNRNNLKAILTKEKLNEKTSIEKNKQYSNSVYELILLNNENSQKTFTGTERTTKDHLNVASPKHVDFQLIDSKVFQLLKMQFSTTFYNSNIKNIISGFINYCCNKINSNNKPLIDKIDILEPDNKSILSQLFIPDYVKLLDVPNFIQKQIGVYNCKLGSYIQKDTWYIFPIYDTSRFNSNDNVTVYLMPKSKTSNIERTYTKNESKRIILTSDSVFHDDNATNPINYGDGVSYVDADKLFNNPILVNNNKVSINRPDNVYEYKTNSSKRDFNYAPITSDNVTNNFFEKNSIINAKTGGVFKAVWQNADFNLLRPGISARILFDNNGVLMQEYGILIYAEYVSLVLGGIESNRYVNHAVLHFYINKGK